MVLNLRGLGETARAFLLPTMVFIVGLLAIIAIGLIHPLGLNEPQLGTSQLPTTGLKAVTFLLILKAFSAGCSALTGVEAIANGVPLFREPRTVRAKRTEMLLGLILGAMLLGLAVLAKRWQIGPRSGQTVLSQIMAMAVGRGWAYYIMSHHDHHRARPGGQHVVRRAPGPGQPGGPGQLPAPPVHHPGRPADLRQRHRGAGGHGGRAPRRGGRQHQHADPPLRHRGVHRIHAVAGRAGRALVARHAHPIGGAGPPSTASARASPPSPPSSSSSPSSPRAPGWSSSPSRRSSCCSSASTPTTSGPAKELRIDEDARQPEPKYTIVIVPVNRISRLTEHALCEAESLGQEVIRRHGRPRRRATKAPPGRRACCSDQWEQWNSGVPLAGAAHRVRLRRRSRSSPSSTSCERNIPTISSSSSSRSSGRTSCATGSCTTSSTWSSRRRSGAGTTSSWPGSRCRSRPETPSAAGRGGGYDLRPAVLTRPGNRPAQRPFHTGSRFSMNAVAPSLASSLPNTLGCHSAASAARLARGPSTPCARAPWWPAVREARCARSARPTPPRRRAPRPVGRPG